MADQDDVFAGAGKRRFTSRQGGSATRRRSYTDRPAESWSSRDHRPPVSMLTDRQSRRVNARGRRGVDVRACALGDNVHAGMARLPGGDTRRQARVDRRPSSSRESPRSGASSGALEAGTRRAGRGTPAWCGGGRGRRGRVVVVVWSRSRRSRVVVCVVVDDVVLVVALGGTRGVLVDDDVVVVEELVDDVVVVVELVVDVVRSAAPRSGRGRDGGGHGASAALRTLHARASSRRSHRRRCRRSCAVRLPLPISRTTVQRLPGSGGRGRRRRRRPRRFSLSVTVPIALCFRLTDSRS